MNLPSLNLSSIHLSPYAMYVSLGMLLGTAVSFYRRSAPSTGDAHLNLSPAGLWDAILIGWAGGLIGARAAYLGINWAYYRDHLSEGLRPWAGGLVWEGGLAAGLLALACYAALSPQRPSLAALLDLLAPGLALTALFIWLASGAAGAAYGRQTYPDQGWLWRLSADLPDTYHLYAPRVNVQALGAAWSGLVWAALWLFGRRPGPTGTRFCLFVALTGLGGLVLIGLRGDPVPQVGGLRLDGLFNLGLAGGGGTGWLWLARSNRQPGKHQA